MLKNHRLTCLAACRASFKFLISCRGSSPGFCDNFHRGFPVSSPVAFDQAGVMVNFIARFDLVCLNIHIIIYTIITTYCQMGVFT